MSHTSKCGNDFTKILKKLKKKERERTELLSWFNINEK